MCVTFASFVGICKFTAWGVIFYCLGHVYRFTVQSTGRNHSQPAPLMDSECQSMKTLVNAIDYACRLGEGPGNKNISLGSVLKLLLVSHIAVVFAALLVVAVAKSHCIIWQLLWLPELLT